MDQDFDAVVGTSETQASAFCNTLANDISASLGIDPQRVRVVGLQPGSIKATIKIDPSDALGQACAESCARDLEAQAADVTSPLRQRVRSVTSARILPLVSALPKAERSSLASAPAEQVTGLEQGRGPGDSNGDMAEGKPEAPRQRCLEEDDRLFYLKLAEASNDIDDGKSWPPKPIAQCSRSVVWLSFFVHLSLPSIVNIADRLDCVCRFEGAEARE